MLLLQVHLQGSAQAACHCSVVRHVRNNFRGSSFVLLRCVAKRVPHFHLYRWAHWPGNSNLNFSELAAFELQHFIRQNNYFWPVEVSPGLGENWEWRPAADKQVAVTCSLIVRNGKKLFWIPYCSETLNEINKWNLHVQPALSHLILLLDFDASYLRLRDVSLCLERNQWQDEYPPMPRRLPACSFHLWTPILSL